MYEDFYSFDGRPFLPAPQVDRYFPASLIEASRQTLTRCVARAEGAALVIGAAGTGKTLLCQMLAHEFQDSHAIVQLASGRSATRVALLQTILYQLGLPYRGLNEGELRLSLLDALQPAEGRSGDLLLLCDEAHTLPLRLLEEIRMLTNLVRDGKPRVHVVLFGSPVLEERFASPKLSSFAQRLAARCYLEPLNAAETASYVLAQIQSVGGAADLVDETCLRTIYRASDGVPRLINQVCDHALLLASLGGQTRLSAAAIEEAWADLQQLPTPFRAKAGAADVVEFGSLDDGSEELREAIPFRAAQTTPLHVACPEDQFDAIESQLREVEQLPEGTLLSGTEVDLDFPEFADAFAEQFDEEEVVLDRFATDIELFADVPRVTSWEGQRLAATLEPLDFEPQPPSIVTPLANFDDFLSPSEPPAIILGPMSSYVGPDEIACAAGGEVASISPQIVCPAVIRGESDAFWIDGGSATQDQAVVAAEEPRPSQPQPAAGESIANYSRSYDAVKPPRNRDLIRMTRVLDALKALESRRQAEAQAAPRKIAPPPVPASLPLVQTAPRVVPLEAPKRSGANAVANMCLLPTVPVVSDHYQELAESISQQLSTNYCNVLLFVSADDHVEPSFSMTHLAQAFSLQSTGDVLLVDGDLHNGRLSKTVCPPGPGLAEAMQGTANWLETIHPTTTPRIDFVGAVPAICRQWIGRSLAGAHCDRSTAPC